MGLGVRWGTEREGTRCAAARRREPRFQLLPVPSASSRPCERGQVSLSGRRVGAGNRALREAGAAAGGGRRAGDGGPAPLVGAVLRCWLRQQAGVPREGEAARRPPGGEEAVAASEALSLLATEPLCFGGGSQPPQGQSANSCLPASAQVVV